jgi:thiol-disulfide isomerase/thioredoxin
MKMMLFRRSQILYILISLMLLAVGGLLVAPRARASALAQSNEPVVIYFFWGDGCPHCATQKPFL